MKKWNLFLCVLFFVIFVSFGPACQQSGGPSGTELRGAIQKDTNNGGLHIRSGGKVYTIESQKDLSGMVGKMATLKGTITEKEGKSIFTVDSAEEK